MSDGTAIQWTDATWTPIRAKYSTTDEVGQVLKSGWHCERVSPGCQHCYAERLNEKRFGTGLPYNRKSRDMVEVYLDERALSQPLHWRKPRRVFVCSMTDLFGEWVPDEMIDRVFAVMALSKPHTFQVLTKRPKRMREYLSTARERIAAVIREGKMTTNQLYTLDMAGSVEGLPGTVHGLWWPLPNVWLGVSVENQRVADERIPDLLDTPAAVRFVSCEPLLGPVDFTRVQPGWLPKESHPHDPIMRLDALQGLVTGIDEYLERDELGHYRKLDWVIVGGESGPGARSCDVDWIRGIVQQCQSARVPVFVKQLGAKPLCVDRELWERDGRSWETIEPTGARVPMKMRDPKGGEMWEWPEDLRVRQYPEVGR